MKRKINLVDWAADGAASLLLPLGNRWLHVQSVVKKAQWVSQAFDEDDRLILVVAAYMHDIGYAPSLKKTGFHPLDGAYYLRSLGYERLASLVAYHSESRFEAQLRGLETALNAFHRERSAIADALTYCDMTTGPGGDSISFRERITDIFLRYGETDIVTQSLRKALPYLSLSIARTTYKLRRQGFIS